MPLYEYRCGQCGHELEVLQKIGDSPLVECPACAQPALKKLVSAAGFRLKGSGWYETDFKGGKKKNLHESGEKREGDEKHDSGEKKEGGEKKDIGSPQDTKKEKPSAEKKPAAKPEAPATG